MRLTWDQVLTWRLRRQCVSEPADTVTTIVERTCGIQAQVGSAAETGVALRSTRPGRTSLGDALASGALIKTWSVRGTLHALTPEHAAALLALLASGRTWEKPVWQRNFGASPEQVAALTDTVSQLLADSILTRDELVEALVAQPRFAHLGEALGSGWGALLKPLAWQGALCHGPPRDGRVTFTAPANLITDWPGPLDPAEAAPTAVLAYLRAYGPATPESFDAWLSRNSLRKTVVRRWFADLGDALTEVEVEGRRGYVSSDCADELAATVPVSSVHLLGGFDQYILGPGTADTVLLDPAHRARVSRAAGHISPLVVVDGRIAGTWEHVDGQVRVDAFDGARIPADALTHAADRVTTVLAAKSAAVGSNRKRQRGAR